MALRPPDSGSARPLSGARHDSGGLAGASSAAAMAVRRHQRAQAPRVAQLALLRTIGATRRDGVDTASCGVDDPLPKWVTMRADHP
jgi:hypothetical protein